MTTKNRSALQTAMQGGKVTDKAAQSALSDAVGRIAALSRRAHHSKEAMVETGTVVLHSAETQGALFLASMAEGYLGEDKLKMGAVDLRAPVGLLAQGYGLYQTMTGQKGAGAHVLAVGTGLMGSWLATLARNAGRTLAEKRAQPAPMQVSTVPPPVMLQGPMLFPEPGVSGPVREVLLTPETQGDDFGRGGRHKKMRRRIRKRVERRMERRQDREQPDDGDEESAVEGEFGRRRRRNRFVRAEDDSEDLD
ncbi:MAG: hypothetical protein ABMB14_08780 [Myxococcota bacterium]